MTGREARAAALTALLLAPLTGCRSCTSEGPVPVDAGVGVTVTLVAPEPWTMGAVGHGGVVLPPPCMRRGDALRTVLPRDTRIASEPGTRGQLLAAVGGEASVRGSAQSAGWQHDAAGLVTMTHGRTPVRAMPWPDRGGPLAARAGADQWLVALDRSDGLGGRATYLWSDAGLERLGNSPPLRVAALRCVEHHCALLSTRLDPESGWPLATASGATLWVGEAGDAAASWVRVDLPAAAERPLAPHSIASMSDRGDGQVTIVVTLVDEVSVHFVAVQPPEPPRPLASLAAPHGVLDAIANPAAAALTPLGGADTTLCEQAGGGVALVRAEGEPVVLRSTTQPRAGALHRLRNGLLVTWLSPARCGSPRQRLHAAVLRSDDQPVAPVTVVGEADEYAVATRGSDLDLWIRESTHDDPEAVGKAGTVTWVQARCRLPAMR